MKVKQRDNSLSSFGASLIGNGIWIVVFAILLVLVVLSLLYTALLLTTSETTVFQRVRPTQLIKIALFLVCTVALFCYLSFAAARIPSLQLSNTRNVKRFLLGTLFLFAVIWVLATQSLPRADQLFIQDFAKAFYSGDYSGCRNDKYLGTNPHQIGLVWFSYFLGKIFGFGNYLPFQIINAIAFTGIFFFLSRFAEVLGIGERGQLIVIACGYAFFPFIFMCSFVYGNLIGLCFALWSCFLACRFFSTATIWNGIVSAIMMAIAVSLKSNYLVFAIALCLISILVALRQRKVAFLIIIPCVFFGVWAQDEIILSFTRFRSGFPLDQGASSLGWIAMGLQDGPMAPGWYNFWYSKAYAQAGYVTEVHQQIAMESIRSSLSTMLDDPRYGLSFFGKKIASQWCNPDFQCYWNVLACDSANEQPRWVLAVLGIKQHTAAISFLKGFQVSVYMFVCVGLLSKRKELVEHPERLLLLLVFGGGFLCHLFWEGKAQYTVSYFVLLFPYAVLGVRSTVGWALTTIKALRMRLNPNNA